MKLIRRADDYDPCLSESYRRKLALGDTIANAIIAGMCLATAILYAYLR